MGSIVSSIVGGTTTGGAAGINFTPERPEIATPTTVEQAQQQYKNAQDALQQQQNFVNAVQAQNGLANQSSVYNQLQNVANGQGPNPAQAMLHNATGANVANQASLMAGQRGSSSNTGLIARQAAQQGANIQQQAVGQGAAMQAQQSLGALQGMGGLATSQANQLANATGSYTQAAQQEQSNILNAIAQQNAANAGVSANMNQVSGNLANTVAGGQMNFVGNMASALGSALMADGGPVPKTDTITELDTSYAKGPKSKVGQYISDPTNFGSLNTDVTSQESGVAKGGQAIGKALGKGLSSLFGSSSAAPGATAGAGDVGIGEALPTAAMAAEGGKVPAMVSPGEVYLSPDRVKDVEKGADPIKTGKKIPGEAKYDGNDYRNDTVPATLESGGIVLPKSIMEAKHPHLEAQKFVSAIMAKNGKQLPKKK